MRDDAVEIGFTKGEVEALTNILLFASTFITTDDEPLFESVE